ncbi:MAG: glutathione peroxidase [Planctomycetota bacterium]
MTNSDTTVSTDDHVSIYGFEAKQLDGTSYSFNDLRDKVALIVNVASKCGFTPQYQQLQELYDRYTARGFVVMGFPCNQFGMQEPGSDAEIGQFCSLNYGVTFPMFAKIDVNGQNANPVFSFLKKNAPGLLGTEAIKWNFTKFLVDRSGKVVDRFAPSTSPNQIANEIELLLGQQG